jgi:hypothetical protein
MDMEVQGFVGHIFCSVGLYLGDRLLGPMVTLYLTI